MVKLLMAVFKAFFSPVLLLLGLGVFGALLGHTLGYGILGELLQGAVGNMTHLQNRFFKPDCFNTIRETRPTSTLSLQKTLDAKRKKNPIKFIF